MGDENEKRIIQARITAILRSHFSWIPDDGLIEPSTRFVEDLRLDSINLVTLQITLEDEFGFRYDPSLVDFAEIFSSMSDMVNFIAEQLKSRDALRE